jgi:hypothetical protein
VAVKNVGSAFPPVCPSLPVAAGSGSENCVGLDIVGFLLYVVGFIFKLIFLQIEK